MNMPMKTPKIIGIAGTLGAGKDTASSLLESSLNYMHISTSDMVRAESVRVHRSIDRDKLQATARSIRIAEGAGALSLRAIQQFRTERLSRELGGVIVSGIRAVGEAEAVQDNGGVVLFIDAPVEVRHARIASRRREGEVTATLQEFIDFETQELTGASASDQSINGIRVIANHIITNSGDVGDFNADLHLALGINGDQEK